MGDDEFDKRVTTLAEARAVWADARKYKIVRNYQRANIRKRIITTGLTLAEAQAHCKDPETSSSTCTKSAGRARTRRLGPWFDGYTEDR